MEEITDATATGTGNAGAAAPQGPSRAEGPAGPEGGNNGAGAAPAAQGDGHGIGGGDGDDGGGDDGDDELEESLGRLMAAINPRVLGTGVTEVQVQQDKTWTWIALYLTWAIILISFIFAIVTALLMWVQGSQPTTSDGKGGPNNLEKLMPFVTLLIGQTPYPLATIAIGWYFAARQNEPTGGDKH